MVNRGAVSDKSTGLNRLNQPGNIMIIPFFFLFFVSLSTASPVLAEVFINGGDYVRGYGNHGAYYGDYNLSSDERVGKGDSATGTVVAILLALANIIVLINLVTKGINRLFTLNPETRESICSFNQAQKRYLKGMHYVLNPIALCMAVVHFHLSACWSILPDAALLLFIIIGALGVVLKFQLCTKDFYRVVYRLHCSYIGFSIVFMLLIIGHGVIWIR